MYDSCLQNVSLTLYDFKIRLNLIKESNPEEGFSCPNFKLRIPTGLRVTGSENKIDYKDIQYNYNINNIFLPKLCQFF